MARPIGALGPKRRRTIANLQDLLGKDFDPLLSMIRMADALEKKAMQTGESKDMVDCANTYDKVLQYIMPRLKAVDVTSDDNVINMPTTIQLVAPDGNNLPDRTAAEAD